jgi:hypothetical protein
MDKRTWIKNEIAAWRAEGLVDAATAERLEARYAAAPGRLSWGILLAGVFGAFLVGLGVIALVAANWDAFGRAARTAVAFAPVVLCGGATLLFAAKEKTSAAVMEPMGVLWFAAVAAGATIVAQTYQVGDSVAGLLLFIAVLAYPALFAVRARVATVVWTVFAIVWACVKADEGGKSAVLAWGALGGIPALSAAAWTWAVRCRGEGALTASCRGAMGLAWAAGLPLVAVLAMPWHIGDDWHWALFFGAALATGVLERWTGHKAWSVAGTLVAIGAAVPTVAPWHHGDGLVFLFYCISLAYALFLAVQGVWRRNLWRLNAGTLLAAWLVLGKFCGSDVPFTVKGVVLIAAGVALWALNFWMVRLGKREAAK